MNPRPDDGKPFFDPLADEAGRGAPQRGSRREATLEVDPSVADAWEHRVLRPDSSVEDKPEDSSPHLDEREHIVGQHQEAWLVALAIHMQPDMALRGA